MKKTIFSDLKALEKDLENRIIHTKKPLAIIGGHYAIDENAEPLVNEDDAFGIFPEYTMDLACRLISRNKKAKLILLVDDHSQQSNPYWYMEESPGDKEIRKKIENYFKNYKLPTKLVEIMSKYNLNEDILLNVGFLLGVSTFSKL